MLILCFLNWRNLLRSHAAVKFHYKQRSLICPRIVSNLDTVPHATETIDDGNFAQPKRNRARVPW